MRPYKCCYLTRRLLGGVYVLFALPYPAALIHFLQRSTNVPVSFRDAQKKLSHRSVFIICVRAPFPWEDLHLKLPRVTHAFAHNMGKWSNWRYSWPNVIPEVSFFNSSIRCYFSLRWEQWVRARHVKHLGWVWDQHFSPNPLLDLITQQLFYKLSVICSSKRGTSYSTGCRFWAACSNELLFL